jgi:hypothetical protein
MAGEIRMTWVSIGSRIMMREVRVEDGGQGR